ncbi:MAG TPA: phenylalanine--tRNA ligase subunit beta, partial [Actinomycetota bacterium]|nr:phenylalanine--tRNA ligase subunit beta [Actinomycetota bacterium]
KWLEEFVRVDVPVAKLVDLLDLSGTKVEEVIAPTDPISGVVVAEILQIVDHPNADNLTLVDVETSPGEQQRVVCGARNISVGDKVPLATVGAHLPGLDITERKIRGEVSRGMLCSAQELGVARDHSGILVLPGDAGLGEDVSKLLQLDDTMIELEITPNRPDCMSMLGIAREVGALLGHEVTVPPTDVAYDESLASPVSVDIRDPERCPRYVATYIEGVRVAPSPLWMAARLLRAGIRPISNIVDVTNYVMLELGQPLHAFDATKIHDRKIVVRRAKSGERFTTLDDVERTMHEDDVMIADPRHALGIGGVMGGADSEISSDTTNVILEAAYFDPVAISMTARRQLLRTEASARFERGADPEAPPRAAARAARLMVELAGGRVAKEVTDEYPREITRHRIVLRPRRTNAVLGIEVSPQRQVEVLRSIDLEVNETGGNDIEVVVPGFRPDLRREADLIEEVARLAGFDHLPSTLPPGRVGGLDRAQEVDRTIRRFLVAQGLQEAWTSAFVSAPDLAKLERTGDNLVEIGNPMSEDERALRPSLLPGLLRAAAHNVAHGARSVALFEISRIYEPTDDRLPLEPTMLGGLFAGSARPKGWRDPERSWDFFGAKGVLEALLDRLGISSFEVSAATGAPFHPTRAAHILLGGARVGAIGELHPDVCDRFDVPEATVVFELSVAAIVAALPERVQTVEVPRFPPALIDIAVVVDAHIPAREVATAIEAAGAPEVTGVRLFDLYAGDQIAEGKKSIAFALELRDPDKTLTDEAALAIRDRVVSALRDAFEAELRA